jgi:uncharacterized membrane protein
MKAGRRSPDLVLVAAATLVSLLLIAIPIDGLVKAILLAPFVLILPGYALAAAMFRPGRLPAGERFIYSIVLSVGVAAAGGLAWQAPFPLGEASWTVILGVTILISCFIARRRREAFHRSQGRPRTAAAAAPKWRLKLPKIDVPTALAFLLAAAIAAGAVAVASEGLRDARAESHFTTLWIAPGPEQGTAEVGIENHQGAVHDYRLDVSQGGTTVATWRGRLGARGKQLVPVDQTSAVSPQRLIASLYRDGDLYRRAELEAEPGS